MVQVFVEEIILELSCFGGLNLNPQWLRLKLWGSGYEFLECTHWAGIYELGGAGATVCPADRGAALVLRLGPPVLQFQGAPPPTRAQVDKFYSSALRGGPHAPMGWGQPLKARPLTQNPRLSLIRPQKQRFTGGFS